VRIHRVALGAVLTMAPVGGLAAQDGQAAQKQVGLKPAVPTVASADYGAGRLRRFLLGGNYRRLWEAPIRVPVLDLGRFAGGLRPTERSGSLQTSGLKLVSADGREFRFRSIVKEPARALPDSLLTPTVGAVLDDQNSALHPAAAVVAAALANAAGIPHTRPIIVMLPDDPRLGEFRKEFAGVLGTLEVYPEEASGKRPGYERFVDVVGTEKLAERLNQSPGDRVDARAYLAARLFDMLINDWDRHPGQWRWGTRDRSAPRRWIAIPLDRDRAFSDYGGALIRLARIRANKLVAFDGDYSVAGLTGSAEELDRRLLAGTERSVWDSIAGALQARLNDRSIAAALGRMPTSYQQLSSAEMERRLRERRDGLTGIAASYYAKLARVVDVHATDANDVATVRQVDDGAVDIALAPAGKESEAYFRRRFLPAETREVRVYLHGGDDTLRRDGAGKGPITVRVVFGAGDDHISGDTASAANLKIYDGKLRYGPDSVVQAALDRRPWVPGHRGRLEAPGPDFGAKFGPSGGASFGGPDFRTGFDIGVAWEQRGFRHEPFKHRIALTAGHSFGADAWGLMATADFTLPERSLFWRISAMVSDLEHPWFYGLGNNTVRGGSQEENRLPHRERIVFLELGARRKDWSLSAGPILKYSTTDAFPGSVPLRPSVRGRGNFGQIGLRGTAELDSRNDRSYPTRGVHLLFDATAYPALWDAESAFGTGELRASTYLSAPLPLTPVLALRAGARGSWGDYPWFEAAFLGGRPTLRGYEYDRFGGDAAVWLGSDLRLKLAHLAMVLPTDVGVYGLADVGRVWLDGDDAGQWHAGYGGGAWIHVLRPSIRGSVTFTWGSGRTVVYIGSGFHF
jgi:hypothetical protein